MSTKNEPGKVVVIDGWVDHRNLTSMEAVGRVGLYLWSEPGKDYPHSPASIVINDKPVPLSKVREMIKHMINDNETFISRQGDVNATRIESLKAIAARFGVTDL
jgi:hypothetical protein